MRCTQSRVALLQLVLLLVGMAPVVAQQSAERLPAPRVETRRSREHDLASVPIKIIDLPTALRLGGVSNPEINLARERILEAVAVRQFAAAQLLPTLNAGSNYHHHQGPLQQASGPIIQVNRDSLYVGLGAFAVGGGTVNIPGIVWNANVSDVYYNILITRQVVRQRSFDSDAVRNDMLLRIAVAYLELLRATGRLAIARQIHDDAAEVARVTANYAAKGLGRKADADRAATEREQRLNEIILANNDMQLSSARLCQLLSLDPSVRLQPGESHIVPSSLVPEVIPLPELLTIALTQRPELQERQAAIRTALLELKRAKVLPFSPQVAMGYSAGGFGGGSNVVAQTGQARFSDLADRQDVDVIVFWSLRNLGVGNLAQVRLNQSRLRQTELTEIAVLDRVRAEVASAQARVHARFAQIETNEKAIQSSQTAFQQDLFRTRNREGLPLEVLDSLRLKARSNYGYLDAIIDYNRAHFELYVALGQPPADTLARPVPGKFLAPPAKPMPEAK